tara:strand:+ start:910 stop:1458 length:549 start_codon:yes stop_codon:yes gene_type:complete
MTLVPLLPIFHRFNGKYFDGLLANDLKPKVSIRWSDGKLRNTAGLYRRKSHWSGKSSSEIVLSSPLLENLPVSAVESTLCHEMIHAWIDLILREEEVHGPFFRGRMKEINESQSQFKISIRHQFPVPKSLPKWWGICPSCGLRFPYKRLVRGAACRKCCNTHHGGIWHPSCVLNYEPVGKEL